MKIVWLLTVFIISVTADECPGGSQCPGVETCCLLSSGSYGCCPYSDAVCCPDKEHCCPSGYTCDFNECKSVTNITNTIIKSDDNFGETCPGRKDRCPNHFTCCLGLQVGRYECCPLPNAVCCEDKQHCCPTNSVCNLQEQRCERGNSVFPLFRKVSSNPINSPNIIMKTSIAKKVNNICPDHRYQCQGSDPCCLTPAGVWTCCPYALGSCCYDGYHCCPYGTHCVSNTCVKGNLTMPAVKSKPTSSPPIEDIVCPDKHECPNGNTCCQITSSEWGCCPLHNAVCCEDHLHCCPQGMRCNTTTGTCFSDVLELPWLSTTKSEMFNTI